MLCKKLTSTDSRKGKKVKPAEEQAPQQQQLNIELSDKEAEGLYSNLAILSTNPSEFFIDFARVTPGVPKAKVHARVIMTPFHAKNLLRVLQNSIQQFEAHFGEIKVDFNQEQQFGFISQKNEKVN